MKAQKADALAAKQKELEKAKLELDQLHKKKTQILSQAAPDSND